MHSANTNITSRLRSLCVDVFLLVTVAMSLGSLLYILLSDWTCLAGVWGRESGVLPQNAGGPEQSRTADQRL